MLYMIHLHVIPNHTPRLVQIIATEKEEEILTHSIAAVGSFACGACYH